MAQFLAPITVFTGRGEGELDLQAALAAASDTSLQWENTGREILYVHNGDAAPHTATLIARPTRYSRPLAGSSGDDVPIIIPAGETGFFSFANPEMFNQLGLATATLDAITSVSVGVYQFLNTLA